VLFGLGAPSESDIDSDSSILQFRDSFMINIQVRSLAINSELASNQDFSELIKISTPDFLRRACPGPWLTESAPGRG
jgi:hypothetical protein